LRVLVACEFSGAVRQAFAHRGHHVISADYLPAQDGAPWGDPRSPIGNHYQGDVCDMLRKARSRWDLVIAHPPCTRLCNSGVRWLHERQLWDELTEAVDFFKLFLMLPVPRICIENPVPHMYAASHLVGPGFIRQGNKPYSQSIQPWQFGVGETKRTCLWLKGLPLLQPTMIVSGRHARVHEARPSDTRWLERSRTPLPIARAMARQWG
jgi:hypothetical protein